MSLTVENLRQLLAHLPGNSLVLCCGEPVESVCLTDDTVILNDELSHDDDEAEVENPFGVSLPPEVRCYRYHVRLPERDFVEPAPISLAEAVARAQRLTAGSLS